MIKSTVEDPNDRLHRYASAMIHDSAYNYACALIAQGYDFRDAAGQATALLLIEAALSSCEGVGDTRDGFLKAAEAAYDLAKADAKKHEAHARKKPAKRAVSKKRRSKR